MSNKPAKAWSFWERFLPAGLKVQYAKRFTRFGVLFARVGDAASCSVDSWLPNSLCTYFPFRNFRSTLDLLLIRLIPPV